MIKLNGTENEELDSARPSERAREVLEVCLTCILAYHAGLDVFNGTIPSQVVNPYSAARGHTLNSECLTASVLPNPNAVNPKRAIQQFPGDGYSNVRKLSEGVRRLRGGWERYRRGECEVVGRREEPHS